MKRYKEKDTDAVDSSHLELIKQPDDPAAVGMPAGWAACLRGEEEKKTGEAEGQRRKSQAIKTQTDD